MPKILFKSQYSEFVEKNLQTSRVHLKPRTLSLSLSLSLSICIDIYVNIDVRVYLPNIHICMYMHIFKWPKGLQTNYLQILGQWPAKKCALTTVAPIFGQAQLIPTTPPGGPSAGPLGTTPPSKASCRSEGSLFRAVHNRSDGFMYVPICTDTYDRCHAHTSEVLCC